MCKMNCKNSKRSKKMLIKKLKCFFLNSAVFTTFLFDDVREKNKQIEFQAFKETANLILRKHRLKQSILQFLLTFNFFIRFNVCLSSLFPP